MLRITGTSIAVLVVLAPATALAQGAIRADCLTSVASPSKLTYAPGKHRLWYDRFWNGKCTGLTWYPVVGDGCTEAKPGWNDVVGKALDQAPPAGKVELLAKVCQLGELIGYEWAKDNDKRCLDSTGSKGLSNLEPLMDEKAGGDIVTRVDNAAKKAKEMCPSLKPPAK